MKTFLFFICMLFFLQGMTQVKPLNKNINASLVRVKTAEQLQAITGLLIPSEQVLNNLYNRLATNATALDFDPNRDQVVFRETKLSRKFDLRTYGCVTPVRSQGGCGSCFTFGSMAAYESSILKRNGGNATTLDLSEQQVLNCTGTFLGFTNRCGGGMHWEAMGYMKDVKYIVTEREYPYRAATNDCSLTNPTSDFQVEDVIGIANHRGEVTGEQIKEAIIKYGSVAACIWFTDSLSRFYPDNEDQVYRKTIDHAGWGQLPNHVIQIIGWDDDKNAWLIKNSHGTDWGYNGFGWIEYGANVLGGFATAVLAKKVTLEQRNAGVLANQSPVLSLPPDADINRIRSRYTPTTVFEFSNSTNSYVIDVQDDIAFKGTSVRQVHNHNGEFACDGRNQEWIFMYAGDVDNTPVYRIMNYGFRRFLTANPQPSAESFSKTGVGWEAQRWYIIPIQGQNKVYLRSVVSGLYMQTPSSNSEFTHYSLQPYSGTGNQQYTLISYIGNTGIRRNINAGGFRLNAWFADNKSIDVPGGNTANGTIMTIWDKMQGNNNQQLIFESTGEAGAYFIKPASNRTKCIQAFSSPSEPYADVAGLGDCIASDEQKWRVVPSVRQDGVYIILNKKSGLALAVKDAKAENGNRLIMQDYTDEGQQRWKLEAF